MPLVRVDRPADHIAVVTLDRPEVLNALSIDLAIELDRTLLEVSRDNTVRVIVLTGAGRAFCSGLDLKDYGVGERYYTYTLTGTEGQDFSRKVYVNGIGGTLAAGGPADYETIKADAFVTGDEILIALPPLSAVYLLVEPGTKHLATNNEVTAVTPVLPDDEVTLWPNPSTGNFTIRNIPDQMNRIEISDIRGSVIVSRKMMQGEKELSLSTGLKPGIYLVTLYGDNYNLTRKLVIK